MERKKLEDELIRTKASLKDCAETLHTRFENLEEQERSVRVREKELLKKEDQVKRLQVHLEREMQKLNSEKYRLIELKHQMQKDYEENEKLYNKEREFLKELQTDCDAYKTDLKETCHAMSETLLKSKKEITSQSQQTSEHNDVEVALMKQMIKQLQNENSILRTQNREQQSRVQQLAQSANSLMRQFGLTESERPVETVNTVSRVFPQISPLAVPPAPTIRSNNGLMVSNGSGEECKKKY